MLPLTRVSRPIKILFFLPLGYCPKKRPIRYARFEVSVSLAIPLTPSVPKYLPIFIPLKCYLTYKCQKHERS